MERSTYRKIGWRLREVSKSLDRQPYTAQEVIEIAVAQIVQVLEDVGRPEGARVVKEAFDE